MIKKILVLLFFLTIFLFLNRNVNAGLCSATTSCQGCGKNYIASASVDCSCFCQQPKPGGGSMCVDPGCYVSCNKDSVGCPIGGVTAFCNACAPAASNPTAAPKPTATPKPTPTLTPKPTIIPSPTVVLPTLVPTVPPNRPPLCSVTNANPATDTKEPPVTVSFEATASDIDGTVQSGRWYVGGMYDTGTRSGNNFFLQKELAGSGIYVATLEITDNKGAVGTCQLEYKVREPNLPLSADWFQAQGGDVQTNGLIKSDISPLTSLAFLLKPQAVISFLSNNDPELNNHSLSEETPALKVSGYQYNFAGNPYNFPYFDTNVSKREKVENMGGVIVLEGGKINGLQNISDSKVWKLSANEVFYRGGGLGTTVFLIDGGLTIEKDILSPEQPVFITRGRILIKDTTKELNGVFLTDDAFESCLVDQSTSKCQENGEQLRVLGTVAANSFSLGRQVSDKSMPAEFFKYDPWYLANLVKIVPQIGKRLMSWQEVAL